MQITFSSWLCLNTQEIQNDAIKLLFGVDGIP